MDYSVPYYEPHTTPSYHVAKKSTTAANTKKNRKVRTVRQPVTSKHTVEYLSVCCDPKAYCAVINSAPNSVIKTICNAALNVQRGGLVRLSDKQKTLFRQHSEEIDKLVSKRISLGKKRKLLSQRGGAFFIPALIGAALTGLAGKLFGGN